MTFPGGLRATIGSDRHRRIEIDDLRRVLSPPRIRHLDNGLTVCVIDNRRVPVVATAIVYRAGTRDEAPGQGGVAHFLEHMMFKGSERFGPGEIDRLTLSLGGSNNAFTSHDSTLYYFTFAADRWRRALDVEVVGGHAQAHDLVVELARLRHPWDSGSLRPD